MSNIVEIWTDGACSGNPGIGGWAAIIKKQDGSEVEIYGSAKQTTNNKMELTAVIEAIKEAGVAQNLTIHSDSRYVIDGATKWMEGWKKKSWHKADGKPALNVTFWQMLNDLIQNKNITWQWVKGHADNPYNNRCDILSKAEVEKTKQKIKVQKFDREIYLVSEKNTHKSLCLFMIKTENRQIIDSEAITYLSSERVILQGLVKALKEISKQFRPLTIKIFSNSEYLIKGGASRLENWQKNNWLTNENQPVKNKDLWQEYISLRDSYEHKVEFEDKNEKKDADIKMLKEKCSNALAMHD